MKQEVIEKAIILQSEINEIKGFISSCENNWNIRFFKKKKGISVTVSDYMRSVQYFELNRTQRDRFINMLKEELAEKEKELEELN